MAKKIKTTVKLYCPAGAANPPPPGGPALGQHGGDILGFCKAVNERTKGREGLTLPAIITVYEDRTFTFEIKSPPSTILIKRACGLAKASGEPNKTKVGKLTKDQVQSIVEEKLKDLNSKDMAGAARIIKGTARSMGIEVEE